MTRQRELDPKLAFGQAVRKLRLAKGISQETLADEAAIHRTYIGDVERGTRNISLMNMVRIAAALDVSLSRLVTLMEKSE